MNLPHLIPVFASVFFQAFVVAHGREVNRYARRLRRRVVARTVESIRLALPMAPETIVVQARALPAADDDGRSTTAAIEAAPDPLFT